VSFGRPWPLALLAGREDEAALILDALDEPAAICAASGRLILANAAFHEARGDEMGPLRHGEGLFAAFKAARKTGRGEGALRCGPCDRAATVTALGPDRLFVRLGPAPIAPASLSLVSAPPENLIAAAPFGAALIQGQDVFSGAIIEANAAFRDLFGRHPAPGETLADLIEPGSRADADANLRAGRCGPFELSLISREGATAHLYVTRQTMTAGGEAIIAHLLDVTEQKAVQAQLAQRNKMEAVGQLAGGVAHDFNNLLTAIRLRAEELLSRHPLGDPAYESLAEIRETVGRAAEVVRQLLTFSRKATVQRDTLDLGEALGDFEVLLRRLLREDVALITHYGRDIPPVRLDRGLLENAVMNLVVNARDAIRARSEGQGIGGTSDKGVIDLSARRVSPAEAARLGLREPADDDMALIEVADDGPGMAPEVLRKIFEPFYTTKPLGEGTGLGLATVYGVVKQAGGWIVADSAPSQGARLRIFLPAFVGPPALEPPPPRPPSRPISRDLSGQGRILLVEDEALVRGITARLLRARGYEVLEASDGEAALDLAKAHAGGIDLMISDVVMPGLDGPALLTAARPYLQSAPVLFISGYAEAEFSDLLEGDANVSFLAKPLDIKTLAEEVKRRLEMARGYA
jgi:two-component system cell cycle sensor histidine kinase/response regulator CckA